MKQRPRSMETGFWSLRLGAKTLERVEVPYAPGWGRKLELDSSESRFRDCRACYLRRSPPYRLQLVYFGPKKSGSDLGPY